MSPIHLFLVLICYANLGFAQTGDSAQLSRLLEKYGRKNQLMGSIAISENGQIVFQKAIGFSSLNPKTAATPKTVYRIGSVSKTYTAVIILQLVGEGKLKLSDPLSQFYPDWPHAKEITMEHLLRHQSGIHNFGKRKRRENSAINPTTKAEAEAIFKNAPTDFLPGKETEYNNANYVVLSLVAETIEDKPFAVILEERIANPSRFTQTNAGGPLNVLKNDAHSFYWQKGWKQNEDQYGPFLLGAGALKANPTEVALFLDALFTNQLLEKEQFTQMLALEDDMGLGIYEYPFYNTKCYGHAGNIDYFESFAAYFPDKKTSLAICLNGSRTEINNLIIDILRTYWGM